MRWNASLLSFMVAGSLMAGAVPQLRAQSVTQTTPARALFLEGRDFLDDGKFADAEKKFREALAKYPRVEQSDRTAYYLIATLVKMGRSAEARAEIDSFYRNYPQSTWKSDVEEKRISLNGLNVRAQRGSFQNAPRGGQQVHNEKAVRGVPQVPKTIPAPPAPVFAPGVATPFGRGVNVTVTPSPSQAQEILRVILEQDPAEGIKLSKERLKENPSDPAVVANFSVIANRASTQALPFFTTVATNAASSPNTRVVAIYFIVRQNSDKDAVGKALIDVMKAPQAAPVVADALTRSSEGDRRIALDQIALSAAVERTALLERLYSYTPNPQVRSQVVQSVGSIPEPSALMFLSRVTQTEKEPIVLHMAIQAMTSRKDVPTKTLEGLLRTMPAIPVPPPAPAR